MHRKHYLIQSFTLKKSFDTQSHHNYAILQMYKQTKQKQYNILKSIIHVKAKQAGYWFKAKTQ